MSSISVTSSTQDRFVWVARVTIFLAVLCGVYLYYGQHAYYAMDKWVFTPDVRQYLPSLFGYYDPGVINPDDYLGEMTRNMFLPFGYKLLYQLTSYVIDPIVFSKLLPYMLMTLFATIMALASKEIAGISGAIATLIIILSTDIFLERMTGGLPRAFGYTVAALALWGITANRPSYLVIATILGAAFYPVAALFSGPALAVLVLSPSRIGGFDLVLSWPKRLGLIFLTTCISYLIFVPMHYQIIQYGGLLSTHELGKHLPAHYSIPLGFIYNTTDYSVALFSKSLFPFSLILLVTSFAFACFQSQTARRLAMATVLLFFIYGVLALTSDSYFSERLKQYYIPVILLAMSPFLIKNSIYCMHSLSLRPISPRYSWIISCIFILIILCVKPNQITPYTGITISIPPEDRNIYNFIQTLPNEGLVAGWPGETDSIIDNVPYLSKRSVFLTNASHYEFYTGPQNLLRNRFKDLVDAYFSANVSDIISLRNRWKVHYLIVDTRHFKDHPPSYTPELNTVVDRAWHGTYGSGNTFAVLNLLATASIFKQGPIFILDLYQIKAQ
jgi:hypothetical protein